MKNYEYVPKAVHGYNGFDLSFDGVLSQEWGDIVPIVCKEMIPGDEFTCDISAFVRLAPLAAPTYGRIHGYINYFYVPNRILMAAENWSDFMRGGVDGTRNYVLPYFNLNQFCRNEMYLDTPDGPSSIQWRHFRKLFTYLGLPDPDEFYGVISGGLGNELPFRLSMLPFAAYNRIYADYYYPWGVDPTSDALVEKNYFYKLPFGNIPVAWNSLPANLGYDYFAVKKAAYKKDYLTTALLRPQRGSQVYAGAMPSSSVSAPDNIIVKSPSEQASGSNSQTLSAVTMRWAQSFQKFLERNSVAGARYFEQILARFGVKIEAEKLQRSQYLGGSDFWVSVSDVTSTADTESASLGSFAGKGVGLGQNGISFKADDYGFFIACLHLMPESGTPQGIERMWTRESRLDYFTEEFQDSGNRPIYNSEVESQYTLGIAHPNALRPSETGVFGYIPQYAEYKFSKPLLAGDFRMNISDGMPFTFGDLNSMHLYRLFDEVPILSSEWLTIRDDNEFNRIFQDTNSDFDHFWTNIQVKLGAKRPMCGYIEGSLPFANDDKNNGGVNLPVYGTRL